MLLLDEPTTGLDADAQRLVIEAIRVVAAGRTTVVVTPSRRWPPWPTTS
ncbi:MAG TPA: hypothetical protein VFN60_13235 [Acidimicrobiales bacterium]|nr:hypothetical protein [Acidimicrobiales bacterium]